MSALARVSLSASGRSLVLRMSQPSSVAAVRSLQTTQANRDIDSGKSQGYGVLLGIKYFQFVRCASRLATHTTFLNIFFFARGAN